MGADRFFEGSALLVRGFRVLRQEKGLWLWISIPWFIDLIVLFAGWSLGLSTLKTFLVSVLANWTGSGWLFDLLFYPLIFILGIGIVVLWVVVVIAVATVIAAPFNVLLAEKALRRQNGKVAEIHGIRGWILHSLRMILISLTKAVVFAFAGLILFAASFIPGLNLAAAYLSMCVFAADVFDYGFEAQGADFRMRLKRWQNLKPEVMGLGATLTLTSLIPGLTVLALPVAVVGSTTVIASKQREIDG